MAIMEPSIERESFANEANDGALENDNPTEITDNDDHQIEEESGVELGGLEQDETGGDVLQQDEKVAKQKDQEVGVDEEEERGKDDEESRSEEDEGEDDEKKEDERKKLLEIARQKASHVMARLNPDVEVTTDDVRVTTYENKQYNARVLRFKHKEIQSFGWTMEINFSLDYINNELPQVVEKIYNEQSSREQENQGNEYTLSEEDVEKLWQEVRDRADDQKFEILEGKEREKTSHERQAISLADRLTNEVRQRYGLSALEIEDKHTHIIKSSEWADGQNDAVYNSRYRAVGLKEQQSLLVLTKKAVHEFLHMKSFTKLSMKKDGRISEDRHGFSTTDENHARSLDWLNEAVTEELTRKIIQEKAQTDPLFAGEVTNSVQVMANNRNLYTEAGEKLFNSDTIIAGADDEGNVWAENFTCHQERMVLDSMVEKIYSKNSERFADKEAVFDEFAGAMLSGRIEPIQSLVDETFGEGTFARMNTKGVDVNEQLLFVQSLS
ncbi:MAG: hypothetical protein Q7S37_03845 [bacterium]|nr:hypothetical protein [bacterium]